MYWKDFLKPSKWTVILLIILVILSYWFFTNMNTEIFQCKTQPVVSNPPEFKVDICGLGMQFGARRVFTPLGYLMIFLVLIALPYVVACIGNYLIKRK